MITVFIAILFFLQRFLLSLSIHLAVSNGLYPNERVQNINSNLYKSKKMKYFKRWIHTYDENGFVNKEYKKLKTIFTILGLTVIILLFLALTTWTIIEL